MYGDLSRPIAKPLAFEHDEQDFCRLSLLASALSGYPAFATQLNALVTPPVSMTDLSSQLESYTLQPEEQNNGTAEPDSPSFASIGQTKSLVNSPPVVLLHRQSIIRRQHKPANNSFQSEAQQPYDEAGLAYPTMSSYPHDARFLILPDQPPICNSDQPAGAIEVDDTDPKTWMLDPTNVSGHERMRMTPLERPQRQNLVLKNIRYRKSAREHKRDSQKRAAALSRVL